MKPFNIPNRLSSPTQTQPQFSIPVELKNKEIINVADPRSTRAMIALMDMQAVMGGAASHWGGPAAFAELMSAAHGYMFYTANKKNRPWHELFHFVNDAGHCENGLYALKANYKMAGLDMTALKGFRSIQSPLSGHGETHLFPEGVYISNGPLGSGIAQAQGLAAAETLKNQSRVTVTAISDGACMEGEAREALASIPGLAKNKKLGPFVMIISDNNTKLSGRIDADAFSMEPTFASLEILGWKVLRLPNGHDLQACLHVFEAAVEESLKNPQIPIAIHAKTLKGFGVKSTVNSSSGGHGFPVKHPKELLSFLEEIYSPQTLPSEFKSWCEELVQKSQVASGTLQKSTPSLEIDPYKQFPTEKIQVGVAKALIKLRNEGFPLISVTSDLPDSTGVGSFRKEFASEQIDVGVAESNMVSLGIGLSKEGFIPIVDTFSQFGVTKGALPLIMSALSQGPIIGIFSHTGFQDAADGASHQALSYLAMTASIPHTDVYVLSSSGQAEQLLTQAIQEFAEDRRKNKIPHSKIFFLGRENFPRWILKEGEPHNLKKTVQYFNNQDQFERSIALVATGSTLYKALYAAQELAQLGIGSAVLDPVCVSSIDTEPFKKSLTLSKGRMITVDDHQVIGGMGALVTHQLAQLGLISKVQSLGVKSVFGQSAYSADDLYNKHGINEEGIIEAAKNLLRS
jgi:transketolase